MLLGAMKSYKLALIFYSASERSERDTYRGKNEKIGDVCWRASETLSGVTQSRFRYIYLFIYLSVYGVRETSVFARASNYVS